MALGRFTLQRCKVCKKRPQAFSTTGMCRECIDRLFHTDLLELNEQLEEWYGTPTRS
jgi:hypothetical protein